MYVYFGKQIAEAIMSKVTKVLERIQVNSEFASFVDTVIENIQYTIQVMDPQVRLVVQHPSLGDFEISMTPEEHAKFENDPVFRDQILKQLDPMQQLGASAPERRKWSVEDEETLIKLVSERPPLFDHTLPMRQRTKLIVKNLWRDILEEMNVDLDEEAISKKWKNLRDSYMRARSTITKKVASGSSAEQRLNADRIKRNHKHFELLTFLDKTLAVRQTISNLESTSGTSTPADSPPRSPLFHETPSTSRGRQGEPSSSRGRQGEPSSSRGRQGQLSLQDEAFLEAIKELRPGEKREATPIEQFCSRLADGLSKLPRNVSNNLQVEFLTKLVEQENLHL